MDNKDIQFVGGPVGHHGPYAFYKAFKYTKNGVKHIMTLSEFFFVKLWMDSDLLCIGELQLLWIDKNSEQVLASLRLYFLPENTPEGRMDHGEDEVLAIAEKVVLRVEDLITWITVDAEWTWGKLGKCITQVKEPPDDVDNNQTLHPTPLSESSLDFTDVQKERNLLESYKEAKGPSVIVLSYPRYCRYRAMMRRLEGVEDDYLKYTVVNALGGFAVLTKNTRVLFCKETFEYPELEGHELLCNHLAPKLKGRPRGKRKKRSVSPGSESNESESSVSNYGLTKKLDRNGIIETTSRRTRSTENVEAKEFLKKLTAFMKSNKTPIGKLPTLGYKELDLFEFYNKVEALGGYDAVTSNRLWKSIFEDISGNQNSTSAATVIRRHYERFLLPYERHIRGEEYKPLPVSERRRLKSKAGSSNSDAETSESTSHSGTTTPIPEAPPTSTTPTNHKDLHQLKSEGKTSSLRSVRVKPERKEKSHHRLNNLKQEDHKKELIIKEEILEKPSEKSNVKEEPITKTEFIPKTELIPKIEPEVNSIMEIIKIENKEPLITPKEEEFIPEEAVSITEIKAPVLIVETKPEPVAIKTEASLADKNPEPVTCAVAPVMQQVSPPEIPSPVEGKDIAPLVKSGDTPPTHSNEASESAIPNEPSASTTETNKDPPINATEKNKEPPINTPLIIQEIKKRKLDILKEGGLEVTPVRTFSSPTKINDVRPSVIQQPVLNHHHHMAGKFKHDIRPMSPPAVSSANAPKKLSVNIPQTLNISQVSTPSKTSTNAFNYSASTPPKVVQSSSIYTYSEKTVYGNPKDDIIGPIAHTPKFINHAPRHLGGDILDLTVTSPQKPVIEIMRVPNATLAHQPATPTMTNSTKDRTSNSNRKSSNAASILDVRRLSSNLEITLVGPSNINNKEKPSSSHHVGYHSAQQLLPPHMVPPISPYANHKSHTTHAHKRSSSESHAHQKVPRIDESARYSTKHAPPPHISSRERSVSIPSYPPTIKRKEMAPPPSSKPTPLPTSPNKGYLASIPGYAHPTYLSQMYENSKGMSPFLQLDPLLYSAAMQSLYAQSAMHAPPMLTQEHLKMYSELMARNSRNMQFPFHLPEDPSMSKFKKP